MDNKYQIFRGYLKFLPIALFMLCSSCKKELYTSDVFIAKQWKVELSAAYTVPTLAGRTDHAVALIFLMSNNELHYDIYFDKPFGVGDSPTQAKLYLGAAAENGVLLADLKNGAFDGNREVKGFIPADAAMIESLKATGSAARPIYLQVNSTQQPNGMVRGQIDKTVKQAFDVDLVKYNAGVNTTTTGKVYFRVMGDNSLVYNVAVNNVPATDGLTSAHIHQVADDALLMTLATSAADFNKAITLSSASVPAAFATGVLYVDAHSTLYPAGLLKGNMIR